MRSGERTHQKKVSPDIRAMSLASQAFGGAATQQHLSGDEWAAVFGP